MKIQEDLKEKILLDVGEKASNDNLLEIVSTILNYIEINTNTKFIQRIKFSWKSRGIFQASYVD